MGSTSLTGRSCLRRGVTGADRALPIVTTAQKSGALLVAAVAARRSQQDQVDARDDVRTHDDLVQGAGNVLQLRAQVVEAPSDQGPRRRIEEPGDRFGRRKDASLRVEDQGGWDRPSP